eukprot:5146154-Karenia_brevis.AAC.1
MNAGRHFVIEKPQGSKLFETAALTSLKMIRRIFEMTFAQCGVGLVSPEGDPVLKRTTLWSSHLDMAKAFDDVRCEHLDHATFQG